MHKVYLNPKAQPVSSSTLRAPFIISTPASLLRVCAAARLRTVGMKAARATQTRGTFQSRCFEAEAMPLRAMLCMVMELLPGWIVARGVWLAAL